MSAIQFFQDLANPIWRPGDVFTQLSEKQDLDDVFRLTRLFTVLVSIPDPVITGIAAFETAHTLASAFKAIIFLPANKFGLGDSTAENLAGLAMNLRRITVLIRHTTKIETIHDLVLEIFRTRPKAPEFLKVIRVAELGSALIAVFFVATTWNDPSEPIVVIRNIAIVATIILSLTPVQAPAVLFTAKLAGSYTSVVVMSLKGRELTTSSQTN